MNSLSYTVTMVTPGSGALARVIAAFYFPEHAKAWAKAFAASGKLLETSTLWVTGCSEGFKGTAKAKA